MDALPAAAPDEEAPRRITPTNAASTKNPAIESHINGRKQAMPAPANMPRSAQCNDRPSQPGTATASAQHAVTTCNRAHAKPLAEDHVTSSGCKVKANGIANAGVAR